MGTANRVIKNTGFLYAKMCITIFVSLYTTRLILDSLGVTDYGIYNIVGGIISMLGFLNGSMAAATQRFMSYSEGKGDVEDKKVVFNVSFILHLLIAMIVIVILIATGLIFFSGTLNIPEERIPAAIVIYGSLVVSTTLTIVNVPYDAVMNAHENMKYYALVGLIESFLKLAVAFACVYSPFDKLIVYGVLMACIPMITLTIMKVYCHRRYEECTFNFKKYYKKDTLKSITSFAGWSFAGTAASMIGNYGNRIIVNNFFGVALNAAMGIVGEISGQIMALTNNMLKAVNPVIVKNEGGHNRVQTQKWTITSCKLSYLLLAWCAIPMVIEDNYIFSIWLKETPAWTLIFFKLQVVRTLIELTTASMNTAIGAVGKVKWLNIADVCLFSCSLLSIYLLFKCGFSPLWLYVVMITLVIIQNGVKVFLCEKYVGIKYKDYLLGILVPMAIVTGMTVAVGVGLKNTMDEGFVRVVAVGAACVATLCASSYLIGMTRQEKTIINNVLAKVLSKVLNRRIL